MTPDTITRILAVTALAATAWVFLLAAWHDLDLLAKRQEQEASDAAKARAEACRDAWWDGYQRRVQLRLLATQAADLEAKARAARSARTARRYRAQIRPITEARLALEVSA